MQSISFGFRRAIAPATPAAHSATTPRLIYRGITYQLSRQKPAEQVQDHLDHLVGQMLTYRGTAYEITPAMAAAAMPTTVQSLIYRGIGYQRRA